jgi:hypothetical protein
MAKTKISEFSSTPANNTDIDSINIAEGCAPSGINDAIRELMAQLKDFQTGAVGDSFNGPIGTSTAAAGAFTTLSATGAITSTLATGTAPLVIASTTKVANLNVDLLDGADWAAPAALGSTTPAAVSATTLAASSTVTLSGGTANGVAYLNGSNVLTTGSALTFDGSSLGMGSPTVYGTRSLNSYTGTTASAIGFSQQISGFANTFLGANNSGSSVLGMATGTFGQSTTNNIPWTVSAFGSEQMRLNSTGLGIGTSSPSTLLTMVGTTSKQSIIKLQAASGSAGGFKRTIINFRDDTGLAGYDIVGLGDGNNALTFDSVASGTGTTRLTLDSSGNLGLGVTPSAWGSSWKAMQIGTAMAMWANGNDSRVSSNIYFDGTSHRYLVSSTQATMFRQSAGEYIWYNAPSGTAGNAITFTQAMTLDASGNLLVGTTSLGSSGWAKQIRLQGVGNAAYEVTDGTVVTSLSASAGSIGLVGTETNHPLVIRTNNTERARIDSSGNLLVGKTSTGDSTIGVEARANGYVSSVLASSSSANSSYVLYSTGAGAYRFFVDMGGTIHATSTSISAISDATLKTNVKDLETGLTEVMALKPRRFDWLNGDATNVAGFIAQEVEQVLPELVVESMYSHDDEGNEIKKKNLKMGDILPTLVKAIQEQQEIINQLKARLDAANL